jgi:hypothetical protein
LAEQLWSQEFPGIYIDRSDDKNGSFFASASRCLNRLRTKDVGGGLLTLLSKRCQGIGRKGTAKVLIKVTRGTGTIREGWNRIIGGTQATAPVAGATRRDLTFKGAALSVSGTGASEAVALFNPGGDHVYTQALGVPSPSYVALAHELVHCLHYISGEFQLDADPARQYMMEEARTVGLGRFANVRISENAIRAENNLTRRTYYDRPGDCDNV